MDDATDREMQGDSRDADRRGGSSTPRSQGQGVQRAVREARHAPGKLIPAGAQPERAALRTSPPGQHCDRLSAGSSTTEQETPKPTMNTSWVDAAGGKNTSLHLKDCTPTSAAARSRRADTGDLQYQYLNTDRASPRTTRYPPKPRPGQRLGTRQQNEQFYPYARWNGSRDTVGSTSVSYIRINRATSFESTVGASLPNAPKYTTTTVWSGERG